MVKCKVIMEFYDNLEGRNRKKGEEFECLLERAEYLSGKNENKLKVVDIMELIPKPEKETVRKGKTKLKLLKEDTLHETENLKRKKKQIDTVE